MRFMLPRIANNEGMICSTCRGHFGILFWYLKKTLGTVIPCLVGAHVLSPDSPRFKCQVFRMSFRPCGNYSVHLLAISSMDDNFFGKCRAKLDSQSVQAETVNCIVWTWCLQTWYKHACHFENGLSTVFWPNSVHSHVSYILLFQRTLSIPISVFQTNLYTFKK